MSIIVKSNYEVIEDGKIFVVETDFDGKEYKRFVRYTPEKQMEIDDEDAKRKQDLELKAAKHRSIMDSAYYHPDYVLNLYQEADVGVTLAIIQINSSGIQNIITSPSIEDFEKKIIENEKQIADLKKEIPDCRATAQGYEKAKKFRDAEIWYNLTSEKEGWLDGLQHQIENLKENKARAEVEYREKVKEFLSQIDSIMEPFRAVIKEEKKK